MSDYISREEVYQKLHDAGGCGATDEWSKGYDEAIDVAIGIIENAPAADVAQVVHGYWEPPHFPFHWYKAHCSVCGYADERSGGDIETMENYKMPKFCENCGATLDLKPYNEWLVMSSCYFKMDEEKENA